jgi:hypothetical protein
MTSIDLLPHALRFHRFMVAGLLLALAACGGGGGGTPETSAAWQSAQLLEASDQQAGSADVAINASGVGYAVWVQIGATGDRTEVMSSRYVNGAWGPAQVVSKTLLVNDAAQEPKVVVHPDGRATAIWSQPTFTGEAVVTSTTDVNGNWPDLPSTVFSSLNDRPQDLELAPDGDGKAMAIWRAGQTIHASRFIGGNFQAVQQVSEGTANEASSPDVSMHNGDVAAVWVERAPANNNRKRVFVRTFSNGAWSPTAFALSSALAQDVSVSRVALSAQGKAVATWLEVAGVGQHVMARVALNAIGFQWSGAQMLSPGPALAPAATMDAQGRALVAWEELVGGRSNILASRFDGSTWKNAFVESDDAGSAATVQLGLDGSGRAFAVWSQFDGTQFNTMANRFDPVTGEWGVPERIESENRGGAFSPSLAVNSSSRALAAWSQQNGTNELPGGGGPQVNSIAANVFK